MTGDADMRVLALMDGPLHGAPVYSGYSTPIPPNTPLSPTIPSIKRTIYVSLMLDIWPSVSI